ncbi:MAG: zinc ribbon domain-containing protein [Actinobacteria bacterium]|nr:zinc ribbon domain-containing protein [Actinomycetota bacterium]
MADVTPRLDAESPVSGERACPQCGAQNPDTAQYCWQCYATFAGAASSAPASGWAAPTAGPRGIPLPLPVGLPNPQPAGSGTGVKIGASILSALVAAAVGWLVVGKLFGTHIEMPGSVAGYTKLSSELIDQGVEQFHKQIDDLNVEGDMAFYGTGDVPRLSLIWFKDPSSPDGQTAFQAFSAGFGSTSGSAVDTASMDVTTVNGVDYRCAPVSGSFRATMCMWEDDGIYWFVLDIQPAGLDFSGTRDIAVEATRAVAA